MSPFVVRSTTKLPFCVCPVATSVARICAACVGALAVARIWTVAVPVPSVTTVSVGASGVPGLLVMMANGPKTASNRIWRPGSGAPPMPVATTVTAAVSPSQTFEPQVEFDGVIVRPFWNSGAKRTMTLAITFWPDWSATVTWTGTSVPTATGLATRTRVLPATLNGTGRTAESLVTAV
ncbi:MAG: hypothetical protein DYH14_02330 [Betaproteobacteria bacterium PRO3]|nr:hypothetical protein [Betaproteobacteria bacterium PRO3]